MPKVGPYHVWQVTSSPPPPYVIPTRCDWQRHVALTRPWQHGNSYLHAVYHGNLKSIKQHLQNGCHVDWGVPQSLSEQLEEYLPLDPEVIPPVCPRLEDFRPDTALFIAITNGLARTVRLLLDEGPDVDRERFAGWRVWPLDVAADCGNLEIMQMLLDHPGVPEYHIPNSGRHDADYGITVVTPLMTLAGLQEQYVIEQHVRVAKLLLDRGHRIELTVQAKRGDRVVQAKASALWEAAFAGNRAMSQLFLDHGADVNFINHESYDVPGSVVHAAVHGGHTELVQLLLEHGADPKISYARPNRLNPNAREAPLNWAVGEGKIDIVRMLLQHGADPNTASGWPDGSVLQVACYGEHVDIARQLIDAGAVVPAEDRKKIATHLEELC